ncbi:Metal transporter Nramp2 [Heracleum sosnowskyi]|uniref:Metal transporter Nramp2 n=1 Tax=Heracleum sosnowskyi TaxID=360622 RepID=A0AAD8JNC2_9APIA|nr:Metal transporter Nramp2 [Heracleum sosnowskyi]
MDSPPAPPPPPRPSNPDDTDTNIYNNHLLAPESPPLSDDEFYEDEFLSIDIESTRSVIDDDEFITPPFSWKKLWQFTGPGFLMSIAFLDPGNIEGDLQAGAIAGYSLLWLLLWSTVMGLLIQLLSARIGVVTGRHMAEICRDEYPRWASLLLWCMAELALIGADIQEVIGSAIAINILSQGVVPLWAGVIITASDCFFFLFLENYGVRKLEAVFAVLISTMALTFAWMFVDTKPNGRELLVGLLVPKLSRKAIKQAVGIVGCVITPHNVFLHSALVQSRKVDSTKRGCVQEALNYYTIESTIAIFVTFVINLCVTTVFAKGFYNTKEANSLGLLNAGNFLEDRYGGGLFPILYIWGIGLLAAGQSSTLTGTYAGQFIMEGFIDFRLQKWLRSMITRSCAIVPTMIVAVVYNRSDASLDNLNEWLNVLQGMQIPFALIPLLVLVADEHLMGVFRIGPFFEWIMWIVAALVTVINGYVLLDFFSSEVKGLVFGILVCCVIVAYAAFILYLISHGNALPSAWFNGLRSKRLGYIAQ